MHASAVVPSCSAWSESAWLLVANAERPPPGWEEASDLGGGEGTRTPNPLLANHRPPCEELADRADGEVVGGLLRPAGALTYGTTMARRQLPGSPARRRGCVGTVTVWMRTRSLRSRPSRVAHRDDTPGRVVARAPSVVHPRSRQRTSPGQPGRRAP